MMSEPSTPADVLEALSASALNMVGMLNSRPGAFDAHVTAAQTHVDAMLSGFRTCLVEADTAEAARVIAASAAKTAGRPDHPTGGTRWKSKRHPAEPTQAPLAAPEAKPPTSIRLTGKQEPKRLITDF